MNSRPLHYQWSALPLSYRSLTLNAPDFCHSVSTSASRRRQLRASPGAGRRAGCREGDSAAPPPPPLPESRRKLSSPVAGDNPVRRQERGWTGRFLLHIRRGPCEDAAFVSPGQGAQVAQLVEHATENRSVGGSTPSLGTTIFSRFAIVGAGTRAGLHVRRREADRQSWPSGSRGRV